MNDFIVREAMNQDAPAIAALYTESIHGIAANSYSPQQLHAWAPSKPDLDKWRVRLAPLAALVAEVEGDMAGFIAFTAGGHIEFLFTSPAFSRQGIASALYAAALQQLHADGIKEITTEASLEARPFFERKGFEVIEEQFAERGGDALKRYLMKCILAG